MAIIEDMLAYSRQRVKNPYFMAFLFSWVFLNHDYIFIMLSGDSLSDKFSTIDSELYNDGNIGFGLNGTLIFWIRSVIAPLCMAAIYIGLMPYFQHFLIRVWDTRQTGVLEAQKKALGKTLITIDEKEKMQDEMDNADTVHRKHLREKQKHIRELEKSIEELKAKHANYLKQIEEQHVTEARNLETKTERYMKRILELEKGMKKVPIGDSLVKGFEKLTVGLLGEYEIAYKQLKYAAANPEDAVCEFDPIIAPENYRKQFERILDELNTLSQEGGKK